ncbi:MAG TPA: aminotransferase [Solirubrobacteraceae bacterium]|nr:aminotransferase [Solirubrobacteraceae bacterium]
MAEGVDFFALGALPAPRLSAAEATWIAGARFGIDATAHTLGSQQDQNFLLSGRDGERPLGVLKLANSSIGREEIEAQVRAAEVLARRLADIRVATTLLDSDGERMLDVVESSEGPLVAHVVRYLPGQALRERGYLSPAVVAAFGTLAACVSGALEDFEHGGLARVLQWDLRNGARVVELLAGQVPDPELRARLSSATEAAWGTVSTLADALPLQPGHFDLTDENLLTTAPGGIPMPDGVIDLGDLSLSWRVAELATTISSLLHHPGAEPHTLLPAIEAFHELRGLAEQELAALWPLVVIRSAVLAVSSHQQIALDGDRTHASVGLEHELEIFRRATSVPPAVMSNLIADRLGLEVSAARLPRSCGALIDRPPELLDLSTQSDLMDAGDWLQPDTVPRLIQEALVRSGAVALPHALPQLPRARALSQVSQPTVPTLTEVWFEQDTELAAPWPGDTTTSRPGLVVLENSGLGLTLMLAGANPSATALATAPAGARIGIQLTIGADPVPPHVRPEYAPGWLPLTADAAGLLLLQRAQQQRDHDLIGQRERSLASVQEHYYARPPRIERGWRHHLIDTDARVYLDMVNNVTILGHAHPRVQAAVARQLRRLNTNSRFHYAAIAEFSTRLAALAPEPLDSVFLVNSGSEAVDLALRVALAATGRPDVVAMREAYHGWTYLSDAVSTSIADNPNALGTRPPWVHTVDAANHFRGSHRGEQASRYAPEAVAVIDELAAAGRPPAAFIAESFYGNAGGLALPDGYLEQVYAAVRRHGGLAVADEVQVGYGRLGEWFWGFEQQGVVPDIVAVAKAIGNGHPLGAVITSRELAERYRSSGYFFSSTGGSPVSSVVGLTVLDVIAEEGLQEHAQVVGARLRKGLRKLGEKHALVGAVHGTGLYLGVEFVRDRETLEPATAETEAICDRLLELGVIMAPTGDHQNVLKIKPPLCVDADACDFFVAMLDEVLTSGW